MRKITKILLSIMLIVMSNNRLVAGNFDHKTLIKKLESIANQYDFFGGTESGYWYFDLPDFISDRKAKQFGEFYDFVVKAKSDLDLNVSDIDVTSVLSERAYKVHLMPHVGDLPAIIEKLCAAIVADETLAGLIKAFKIIHTDRLLNPVSERGIMPTLVIYQDLYGYNNYTQGAQTLIDHLAELFKEFKGITIHDVAQQEREVVIKKLPVWQPKFDGITPRFSIPYDTLIFYAQGNSDNKLDDTNQAQRYDLRYNRAIARSNQEPNEYLLHSPQGMHEIK